MSLTQLWNVLRGRGKTGSDSPGDASQNAEPHAANTDAIGRGVDSNKAIVSVKPKALAKPEPNRPVRRRKTGSTVWDQLDLSDVKVIVEIGVRRGTQLSDLFAAIGPDVRYVAVDPFESRDMELRRPDDMRLMDFHRQMRSEGVRVEVYPDPPATAVARIGRTVGGADLVAIDADQIDDDGVLRAALSRISHPRTQCIVLRDGRWSIEPIAATLDARRAA